MQLSDMHLSGVHCISQPTENYRIIHQSTEKTKPHNYTVSQKMVWIDFDDIW